MSNAKKLPSGSWRCQAYDFTDKNGKRHYRSFTSKDTSPNGKLDAEFQAATFAKLREKPGFKSSIKAAIDDYINSKSNVLSPSTIRSYKLVRNNLSKNFSNFLDMPVKNINNLIYQQFINDLSQYKSPKTVRNYNGLITAALKDSNVFLTATLPKKIRHTIYVPTDEDIQELIKITTGTELEIPILLAAFGPLRRGEICALKSDHIRGNIIHVEYNMVLDFENKWITKSPKSFAGNRYIEFPEFVIEKLATIEGPITKLNPDEITAKFEDLLAKSSLPKFRFHDLRHYSVSILHAIGIPDAYIMERGGWGDDILLKNVYRHCIPPEKKKVNSKINSYFTLLNNQNT